MGCCGGTRPGPGAALGPGPGARPRRSTVEFEYVGATAMTVTGPATGRRYRFDGPGARVVVDPRDRPGLAAVPRLRQLA
jgi:hypothetical protein